MLPRFIKKVNTGTVPFCWMGPLIVRDVTPPKSQAAGSHALPNATCNPPVTPCGMWPGFLDMNPAKVSPTTKFRDLYGQPKIVSVVQRNYRARGPKADPWNLFKNVNIRLSQGEEIDTNGFQTSASLDISMQTAIATGLAAFLLYCRR